MDRQVLPLVEVSVALVTDEDQRILWILNDKWGAFALPMTKRHRGREATESAPRAALRAAAEALGVPVRLVEGRRKHLTMEALSGRQLITKQYAYAIFHVEAHPDFAGRLQVRQPHLWLSPHLAIAGVYEPLAEPSRRIVIRTIKDFDIPVRIQHTSVVIVRREHPERGPQFLLLRNDDWGYALPAQRREPSEPPLAGAERVARDELGLEPGRDVILTPASPAGLTTHGVSETPRPPAYGVATDYVHAPFDAELRHPHRLQSAKPLVWVTPEEIHAGWTAGSDPAVVSPPDRPGRISNTVYDLLVELGRITERLTAEEAQLAEEWLRQQEQQRKAGSE